MQRVVAVVLATVTVLGCASSGQVRALETRLSELERAEAERDVQAHVTLTRIEAQLAALIASVSGISASSASASSAEILKKLAELEHRLSHPPAPRRRDPLPDQVYAVAITGDPVKGPADALVTIVRGGEYACPFCERVRDTLDEIVAAYPTDVRIVYKHFIVHPAVATEAAAAGCAANHQGKYWKLDTLLWEKAFKARQFDMAHLEDLAREAGLDLELFRRDVKGPCPAEVAADQAALAQVGVTATPSFFINGRFLSGAQPFATFKALIDEELAKAQDRVKQGTRRKDYYDAWVLKKGLKQFTPPAD